MYSRPLTRCIPWLRKRLRNVAMESVDDLKSLGFWHAVIAEFVGSAFLVLVGCGAWLGAADDSSRRQTRESARNEIAVRVSLTFGLMYGLVIHCLRGVSGGHVNPVVSMALMAMRTVSLARGLLYVLAQCLGAILGTVILYGVTLGYTGSLGYTTLARGLGGGEGFGVEFFAALTLIFVTLTVYKEKPRANRTDRAPVIVGVTVAALSLFTVRALTCKLY